MTIRTGLFRGVTAITVLVAGSIAISAMHHVVISGYAGAQKARLETAQAHNAEKLANARLAILEADTLTQTETARWAADRQAAIARKTTADADKARHDETTARAKAAVARLREKAEADKAVVEADLTAELVKAKAEEARNSERLKFYESRTEELNAVQQRIRERYNQQIMPDIGFGSIRPGR